MTQNRKTYRVDYSNGINTIVDKSVIPERFATVLDNVDLRSGFARAFREPTFIYSTGIPTTTKKIFKYRSNWFYSNEYRDYVAQYIEDQERVIWSSEETKPMKLVNGVELAPLGTAKPKSTLSVGIDNPLFPINVKVEKSKLPGRFTRGRLFYKIAMETFENGISPPSDELIVDTSTENSSFDLSFPVVEGVKNYIIWRSDGTGYKRIGQTDTTTFNDDGTSHTSGQENDDVTNYIDKADHVYVYTYERNVGGMVDESGLSPISNSFHTTFSRTVARNFLTDGYFDQDEAEELKSGITVIKTSTNNPKIKVNNLYYYEHIKQVRFVTNTNHNFKTDDLVVLTGANWTNKNYYQKSYNVIVVSPTIFHIKNIPAPTDVLSGTNTALDGCYVQLCRTRLQFAAGSYTTPPQDGDAVYVYAEDATTEGESTPEILKPTHVNQFYIPPSPTLALVTGSGFTATNIVRYRIIAVDTTGEMSQPSANTPITVNATKDIRITLPAAPLVTDFSDFSHWILFREDAAFSFKYRQNLYGTDGTDARFLGAGIYQDSNQASPVWSEVRVDLNSIYETMTFTNPSSAFNNNALNTESYAVLAFTGKARTDSNGKIVNFANVASVVYDEFDDPDYPFNTYNISLSYAYSTFTDGEYGQSTAIFEYSIDNGESWSIFKQDDSTTAVASTISQVGENVNLHMTTINQVIYNALGPISPAQIKIRIRFALANYTDRSGVGNANIASSTLLKNITGGNGSPFDFNEYRDFKNPSFHPETIDGDDNPIDTDDNNANTDIGTSTGTAASTITILTPIHPVADSQPFDVLPIKDGTYTAKPLVSTATSTGSGATVTFVVENGVVISATVVNAGTGYVLDEILTVLLNYPTERKINNIYWNPSFQVTGIVGGYSLTASSVLDTGASIGMRLYNLQLLSKYDKEKQVIDGLYKITTYAPDGTPLPTNNYDINVLTPYWTSPTQLNNIAKWVPRNGYYQYWNLYRTGVAGTYQLVEKIPIDKAIYKDNKSTAYLGTNPTSYYVDTGILGDVDVLFNKAPVDLQQLKEHFGMYFGISGNAVRWTPIGQPDAWPDTFFVTLPYKPLALKSFANSLIILCEDAVYRLDGNSPVSMSLSKTQIEDGCIAANSVQATSSGLVYLSKRGLMVSDGQRAKCVSDNKINPIMFTSTSRISNPLNFWWVPTAGSYFYSNLASEYGIVEGTNIARELYDIQSASYPNSSIKSFTWFGKYFIYWSNTLDGDYNGHTCICLDLDAEGMPITTLGLNAIDVVTDELDNVYALFGNQGDASQENLSTFKSQMLNGSYDTTKFKTNSGVSIWQLFSGRGFIPMTIRTGYKRIDTLSGNPFDRKVYDCIDFNGVGNVTVRAYLDGYTVANANILMEETPKKVRRLNLPASKRTGYNLDIEVFGETSRMLIEVSYREIKGSE